MPNHCSNKVIISGPKEVIAEIASKLTESKYGSLNFDFDVFLPMPKELKGIVSSSPNNHRYYVKDTDTQLFEGENWQVLVDADGVEYPRADGNIEKRDLTAAEVNDLRTKWGACDWYEWNNNKIGTKWGYYDQEVEVTDEEIIIRANSAWCPAHAGLCNISTMYPDVTITNSFAEQGSGYLGTVEYKAGISEELYSYNGPFYEESEDEDEDDWDAEPVFLPEVDSFLEEHGIGAGG